MYKKIVEISEQLIANSYTTNKINEDWITQMNLAITNLLKSGADKEKQTLALELYRFFTTLKAVKQNTYDNKIKVLTDLKHKAVLSILISQYLKSMPSNSDLESPKINNLFSILKSSKKFFINDLYFKALVKDNLDLFSSIYENLEKTNNQLLEQFERALIMKKNKILDYLFSFISGEQVIKIINEIPKWNLSFLSDENKLNMIKKVFLKSSDTKSNEQLFLKLNELNFNSNNQILMDLLLSTNIDINCEDKKGVTCLQRAAFSGSINQIKYLLSKNADPNINAISGNNIGGNALNFALHSQQKHFIETIQILLEAKVNLETINAKGLTPLLKAVQLHNLTAVQLLVEAGAKVQNQGQYSYPALHIATEFSNAEMMKYLIKTSDDLNVVDIFGNNALHYAATIGIKENIEYLLKKGLDVNSKDVDNHTPIHLAIDAHKAAAIMCLAEHNADLNSLNKEGYPVFISAALNSTEAVLKFLKDKGADINITNSDSYTALHTAVVLEKNKLIKTLIALGVNIEARTSQGNTAIQLAVIIGNSAGFDILKNANANVFTTDEDEQNLLHLAVAARQHKFIKPLANLKININAISKNKFFTPIDISLIYRELDIFKELLKLGANFNPEDEITKTSIEASSADIHRYIKEFQKKKINKAKQKAINTTTVSVRPTYQDNFEIVNNNVTTPSKVTKASRRAQANQKQSDISKKVDIIKTTSSAQNNKRHIADANKGSTLQATQQTNFRQKVRNPTQHNAKQVSEFLIQNAKQMNTCKKQTVTKQNGNTIIQTTKNVDSELPYTINSLSQLELSDNLTMQIEKRDAMRIDIINNFPIDEIRIIHRSKKLDHESGRPVIIININNNIYTVILGSSKPPNNFNNPKFLALTLSENKEVTYFYKIIVGKLEAFIRGPWNTNLTLSRDSKSEIVQLLNNKTLFKLHRAVKATTQIKAEKNNANNNINLVEQDSQPLLSTFIKASDEINQPKVINQKKEKFKEKCANLIQPDFIVQ